MFWRAPDKKVILPLDDYFVCGKPRLKRGFYIAVFSYRKLGASVASYSAQYVTTYCLIQHDHAQLRAPIELQSFEMHFYRPRLLQI